MQLDLVHTYPSLELSKFAGSVQYSCHVRCFYVPLSLMLFHWGGTIAAVAASPRPDLMGIQALGRFGAEYDVR
jgi:hypothetical protein